MPIVMNANPTTLQAGMDGLSNVYNRLVLDGVIYRDNYHNLLDIAMIPAIDQALQVTHTVATGPNGRIQFSMSSYDAQYVPWERGTTRVPWLGGTGAYTDMGITTAAITERLEANKVIPFGQNLDPSSSLQKTEMGLTLDRVLKVFGEARTAHNWKCVMDPFVANTLVAFDGELLFSVNHTHLHDTTIQYSNLLTGGVQVAHQATGVIPPTRVTVGDPTLQELWEEITFFASHFGVIRTTKDYQKITQPTDFLIVAQSDNTQRRLLELNTLQFADWLAPGVNNNRNSLFGKIEVISHAKAGVNPYFIIPKIEDGGMRKASFATAANPLEMPVIDTTPRPIIFAEIRDDAKFQLDLKYDPWTSPNIVEVSRWSAKAVGAGMPSEAGKFIPAAA